MSILNYYNNINPKLPVYDQLFLVLVKLRTYRTNYELHRMFGVKFEKTRLIIDGVEIPVKKPSQLLSKVHFQHIKIETLQRP